MTKKIKKINLILLLFISHSLLSQSPKEMLNGPWKWENVGPNRGGRSIAVTGHTKRPFEYYFGATGGGIWKTNNGGQNWDPVTDGQLNSSSVGAIAIAPSDPDIIYAGMGEAQLRSNVMQGDGIYISKDGGKTWKHSGMPQSKTISQIKIHPSNADIAWVAVLGNPFIPNEARGIYQTKDGGVTWEQLLFVNNKTGAIDLDIDPNNPSILYATFWEVYRKPWKLWSGGAGSSIYKTTDGGKTWQNITKNEGLPEGVLGKITVSISPANSERVYLNIEAEQGGLYRTDNSGKTWQLINDHRDLWQRAFYFMRIKADPLDEETVYIMNFKLMKSTDGGKNYQYITTPHADVHDLWIDPQNTKRIIAATDGGGVVSVDGGKTWSKDNMSTAQIYRLTVTKDYPYQICGAQQDNYSYCLSPYDKNFNDPGDSFYPIGGGENSSIVQNPVEPNIIFSSQTNELIRYNRNTQEISMRQPYPYLVMGEPASAMPERWNWVYPMAFSSINPHRLYVGSQHLWESEDEGLTWKKISPGLTKADPETLGDSGGAIVLDQDGPEIYSTIYTIAPSPHDENVIFTGSDDGLVHLTMDRGKSWKNITPPDLPSNSRIGKIVASKHTNGKVYLAARRYEMGDRKPYVYKTDDFGSSWTKITKGILEEDFAHIINEDPKQLGLLYLGTEHKVYVSFDDGIKWLPFQTNLPDTQVSGIEAEEHDLIISTHGRGFWILKNIEPIREYSTQVSQNETKLFKPGIATRGVFDAAFYYFLNNNASDLKITIKDSNGDTVKVLSPEGDTPGLHKIIWDLRYTGATVFDGIILEGRNPKYGPTAVPGNYEVTLYVDGKTFTQPLKIIKDPRLVEVTQEDLQAQLDLSMEVRNLTSLANEDVIKIRSINVQLDSLSQYSENKKIQKKASDISGQLQQIASQLYQVKNVSPKDKIAFPIKLNNRLSGLYNFINTGSQRPPKSFYEVKDLLKSELLKHHKVFEDIMQKDLKSLNDLLISNNSKALIY